MATDLDLARTGDEHAFERLVAPFRRELLAHCYRVLGSPEDAEDAVQDCLLGAWRGLAGFEERSSLRTWLHQIAARSAIRVGERRGPRLLSWDRHPAVDPLAELGDPMDDDRWVEPWLDPARVVDRQADVELAYVAAMQHLPARQRAVLVLREVLGFSADEVAATLDTTRASVNSALQRARATLARATHGTDPTDVVPLATRERVVAEFAAAFVARDVVAVSALLTDDVRFTMPPLPDWLDGRRDVSAFLEHRVFATPWLALPCSANGTPGLVGYQEQEGVMRRSVVMAFSLRAGRIDWIATFHDPAVLARLDLPEIFPSDR